MNQMTSRSKIKLWIVVLPLVFTTQLSAQLISSKKVEQANEQLWTKFVDKYGIINDYVGERPSPFDCRLSRPNAFGWWTPIEDGAFFTGLYLVAASKRAKLTGQAADKDKARILAQGLLKCSSVSDVPGFISRGVSTDGKTHYPIGSNDQTIPWFYGLYTYLNTDIPSAQEREIIKDKLIEVVNAVRLNSWKFPSDGMFTGGSRDNLLDNRFLEVPCYLLLMRVMYKITLDKDWLQRYYIAMKELPLGSKKTRAEICAEGISYDVKMWGDRRDYLWIYVMKQAALVELARLENDESMKSKFIAGINANKEFVREFVEDFTQFDNDDNKVFGNTEWRECYPTWYPQLRLEEAIAVSKIGDREKIGLRKKYERTFMTNPLAAASIIALAGDEDHCGLLEKVITHFDYSKLNLAEFFYAEFAYYAMPCHP